MGIDGGVGYEIIHTALKTPRPSGNSAAIGRVVSSRVVTSEPGIKAGAHLCTIRIDIPAIENGEGITAFDDFIQRPVGGLASASSFGSHVVGAKFAIEPASRQRHSRIEGKRVIAAEVHRQKNWSGSTPVFGNHEHQVNAWA